MIKGFRDFILRGNVMDLAVGVIIGAAFGKIVTSMVEDLIMPVVGSIVLSTKTSRPFPRVMPVLRSVTPTVTRPAARDARVPPPRRPSTARSSPGRAPAATRAWLMTRYMLVRPLVKERRCQQ